MLTGDQIHEARKLLGWGFGDPRFPHDRVRSQPVGSCDCQSPSQDGGFAVSTRRGGGLLRVENRACSAPRLLLCLGQRDELLHVTWHRVEPTAGPLLLRLLDALWPG